MVTLLHTRLYDLHLRALSHRPLARGGMREADVAFVINFGLWEIVRFVYQQNTTYSNDSRITNNVKQFK